MMSKHCVVLVCFFLACVSARGTNDSAATSADAVAPEAPDLQALRARAVALASAKKWREAVDVFRVVLKADPADQKVAFGLGTALLQLKRHREALDVLGPLQEQVPDDPRLKNNLAWIYATCPDPAIRNAGEAVKLAQQATLGAPGDPDIWNTLAEAHYAAGEYELALRAARIAVQLIQELAPARAMGFWETLRRCGRAVEPGKKATALDKDSVLER